MSDLIEVELTHKEVDLLFASLTQAHTRFTDLGNYKASTALAKMRDSLHRQIFTYGQLED